MSSKRSACASDPMTGDRHSIIVGTIGWGSAGISLVEGRTFSSPASSYEVPQRQAEPVAEQVVPDRVRDDLTGR
jgi:hypothetical protein